MPSLGVVRPRGAAAVWCVTGLLVCLTVALLACPAFDTTRAAHAPSLPWLGFVVALAVAETLIVHVEFRREAHTFGFSELVLAAGLLTIGGHELVLAQVVGSVIATLARRQVLMKAAFNIAQYTAASAVIVLVFSALQPDPVLLDLQTVTAVLVAATAGSAVSFVLILVVIGLVDRLPSAGESLAVLLVGFAGSAANVGLGLSLLLLLREGALALACAAPAVGLAIASYRAYLTSRQRREHLAFLLEATRALQSGGDANDTSGGWATVLKSLLANVRAESVTLLVAPLGAGGIAGDDGWLVLRTIEGSSRAVERFERLDGAPARALLPDRGGVHDLRRGLGDLDWLHAQGWSCSLTAAIADGDRVLGHLVVGPRLGHNGRYTGSDLVLLDALANQVSGVLETGRLQEALQQITLLKEQMQHEATHDPLTGLANRSLFHTRLAHALTAGAGPVSVMLLDLDDFKAVNDDLGHAAGDALLRAVADRLLAVLRDLDTPARLGGDEFAVVLPRCTALEAIDVAHRLVAVLAEPIVVEGSKAAAHASIGTATCEAGVVGADEMVRRADMALYAVKREGKAGARAWSPELTSAIEGRTDLTATLSAAVADDEFVCHYQPVLELGSERVVALEALVRWQHPERGLLAPDAFLAIAEDSGWIREIGERVLRLSCLEYAVLFHALPETPGRLHVNVSTAQMEPLLPGRVAAALAESGFPGERLVLEITGSLAAGEVDRVLPIMNGVAELGVAWALNDFGTRRAPIGLLAELPVGMVKLPHAMVAGLGTARGSRLVAGALALAREMGLDVVAEGVETRDQADALRQAGCEHAQGYLWAPPLHPVELGQWLRRVPVPRSGWTSSAGPFDFRR